MIRPMTAEERQRAKERTEENQDETYTKHVCTCNYNHIVTGSICKFCQIRGVYE